MDVVSVDRRHRRRQLVHLRPAGHAAVFGIVFEPFDPATDAERAETRLQNAHARPGVGHVFRAGERANTRVTTGKPDLCTPPSDSRGWSSIISNGRTVPAFATVAPATVIRLK